MRLGARALRRRPLRDQRINARLCIHRIGHGRLSNNRRGKNLFPPRRHFLGLNRRRSRRHRFLQNWYNLDHTRPHHASRPSGRGKFPQRERHHDSPRRASFRRFAMPHHARRRAVERLQIHRHALRNQLPQPPHRLRHAAHARHARRTREMRTPLQNAADHATARTARPHFQKQPRAIRIRRIHRFLKIQSAKRLRQNRIRRRLSRHRVCATPRPAVKTHARRRLRRKQMQIAIRLRHRLRDLAMHRRHPRDRKPLAAEVRHHAPDLRELAADHAFARRVHDQ